MKNIIACLLPFLLHTLASAQYPFGGWSTIKIETNLPPNPIDKPAGGKLIGDWKPILIEEFVPNPNFPSKIDEKKWNFGEFRDDSPCSPRGTSTPDPQNMSIVENPDLQGDGLLKMDVISQKHDSCLSFAGGMGSELMTFSNKEDFQSYWLYPDSYIEIRAKQTLGFTGSGCYLYAAWRPVVTEIDLWETLSDNLMNKDSKTWTGNNNKVHDEYSNGYIWGESYKDPNFSCNNKVEIKNRKGKAVEIEDEWLIWGLEWHEDKIRFYLNNVLQREIDLTDFSTCNHSHGILYYKPQPMSFRFVHSNVTSKHNEPIPDSVVKSLYVDYFRVYQPTDLPVIQDMYIPKKICDRGNGGGDNISVRYYPDVIYEWSSPAFDFVPKDIATLSHCFCEMQWMYSKPNLTSGTYPVYLKATLADGRVENHTWQVGFGYEMPSMPTNIVANPLGNSGYYQLEVEGADSALSYAWSLDSVEWKITSSPIWQPFSGGQNLDISVKSSGICDWSQVYQQKVEIPLPPESAVFSENFNISTPISGERIIQEITVYNMMGSLIRRRTVLLEDSWEGMLEGLISGIYVVLYRDKEGKIVSLNKVYVSP